MDRIEREFWNFHHENPHVYKELVSCAREVKRSGRDHYGIAAIYEVVRFHRILETSDERYKLPNNHKPLYARLIMLLEPDLDGFFDIRERTSRGG